MNLAEIFEPRTHVLAYALSFVKADEAGWREVRAGCAGACKVVDQTEPLVGAVEQYNDFGDDKLAVPVYLHKGWNQVLVSPPSSRTPRGVFLCASVILKVAPRRA